MILESPFPELRREIIHAVAILAKREAVDSFLGTNECKKMTWRLQLYFRAEDRKKFSKPGGMSGPRGGCDKVSIHIGAVDGDICLRPYLRAAERGLEDGASSRAITQG
jgi:hypothetical protein